MAALRFKSGQYAGRNIILPPGKAVVLGRANDATLPINDKKLSRHHCQVIAKDAGSVLIKDLGSTNGTAVNGSRLARDEIELRVADHVKIGDTEFEISDAVAKKKPETKPLVPAAKPVVVEKPSPSVPSAKPAALEKPVLPVLPVVTVQPEKPVERGVPKSEVPPEADVLPMINSAAELPAVTAVPVADAPLRVSASSLPVIDSASELPAVSEPDPEPEPDPETVPSAPVAVQAPESATPAPPEEPPAAPLEAPAQAAEPPPETAAPRARSRKKLVLLAAGICAAAVAGAFALKSGNSDSGNKTQGAVAETSPPGVPPPVRTASAKARKPVQWGANIFRQGTSASGCDNAAVLIDGNTAQYDDKSGFAFHDIRNRQASMTLTLNRPVRLGRLRFLLGEKDKRTFRYMVSLSPDGKNWNLAADSRNKDQSGWQEILFQPEEILAVRIQGTACSAGTQFQVVEAEGYERAPGGPKRMPLKTPAPASEADLQPGLWAEYFDDTGTYPAVSDVPAAARVERDLSLNVPSAPGAWPVSGSCAANFSGFIKIDTASLCTFFVYADDSARLYIDGELAVDSSGLHAMDETWGQADLTPGLHRLWVEYSNCGGAAGLNVCMKPKGGDKSPLSPAQLFHAPAETGAR